MSETINLTPLAFSLMLIIGMVVAGIVGYDLNGRDASQQKCKLIVVEIESPDGASDFVLTFDTPNMLMDVVGSFGEGYRCAGLHDVDAVLDEQYEGIAVLSTNGGGY